MTIKLDTERQKEWKPRELIKEEMLPTTSPEVAENLFQTMNAEIKTAEAAKRKAIAAQSSMNVQTSPVLKESQLIVLGRAFPETVYFFRSTAKPKAADVFEAYQRDVFKLTGKMNQSLTFNQEQWDRTIKALNNSRRRTKVGIDPVEYELVVGWFFRGYVNMTPPARAIALKNRGLHPPTAEGIRKLCKRLKLPMVRKPGLH